MAADARPPATGGTSPPPTSWEERRLRTCVRDLVAFSTMPAWWVGRSPAAIAESLRDLLLRMLRADVVYVQLRDPTNGRPLICVAGAHTSDVIMALDRRALDDAPGRLVIDTPMGEMRLFLAHVGLEGEHGRIAAGARRPGFPEDADALLTQVAATQVAVALQNTTLLTRRQEVERELRKRADQHSHVARLGLQALGSASVDDVFDNVADTVLRALHVDCCDILELAADGATFLLRSGAGWHPELVGQARMIAGASHAGFALRTKEPVIIEDFRWDHRFGYPWLLREHGLISGMNVLIHDREAPFGVLGAHSRTPRAFSREDVTFLQSVGNLLAATIQRHRGEVVREELLARTLAAQAETERASRSKLEFVAMLSHELRTPLAAISGYVDLLDLDIHGPLTDAQRTDLGHIRHCQQYLHGLINNVLTFMRLGSGAIQYDVGCVSLRELVASVSDIIRPQMDAKGLRYDQVLDRGDLCLHADRQKLEQILLNLLSNAAKYTDAGGSVWLECETAGAFAHLSVRDTGWGIPAGKLQSVFDPYVRLESGRPTEGTGLGLAISRDLARGMGGDIRVESDVGVGSVFTLVVPLETPEDAMPA